MSKKDRTFRQRRDLILILAVLLAAAALQLSFMMRDRRGGDGRSARSVSVRVAGEETGRYSLLEDREIVIDTEEGHNLLTIRGGEATMTEADCPDGYCLAHHAISRPGEIIVCLPHRVVAEIIAESTDGTEEPAGAEGAAGKESADRTAEASGAEGAAGTEGTDVPGEEAGADLPDAVAG